MHQVGLRSLVLCCAVIGCAPGAASTGLGGAGGAGSVTGSAAKGNTSASGGPTSGGGGADPCPVCISSTDCDASSVCAQIANDSFCTPRCDANGLCGPGRTCVIATTADGLQRSVCVVQSGTCSPVNGSSSATSGAGGAPSELCGTFVGPDVVAACASCNGAGCQANGCFGGWWCDTATDKCHGPPTNCGGGTGGGSSTGSGGGPVTGTVDGNGGKVSSLYFSIVGDTRPPIIDDSAGYPKAIINKIYSDIENLSPRPPFSISTGDYMFAKASGNLASGQLDFYLAARQQFSGAFFPALGNHECTGATNSNCASTTTNNYSAFVSKMLGPIGKTLPYYAIRVDAIDGTWTSKLVFVAANAWSTAQGSWLGTTLSQPTTYTFIVRHESNTVTQAPGVSPSNQIIAQHPYTLEIVGHTHTYIHNPGREVVIGNGGAPLTGGVNYGFGLVRQRADGDVTVDMIDYQSGASDPSFHFAVHPDGTPAAP